MWLCLHVSPCVCTFACQCVWLCTRLPKSMHVCVYWRVRSVWKCFGWLVCACGFFLSAHVHLPVLGLCMYDDHTRRFLPVSWLPSSTVLRLYMRGVPANSVLHGRLRYGMWVCLCMCIWISVRVSVSVCLRVSLCVSLHSSALNMCVYMLMCAFLCCVFVLRLRVLCLFMFIMHNFICLFAHKCESTFVFTEFEAGFVASRNARKQGNPGCLPSPSANWSAQIRLPLFR